jgi:hypothetical protein
MLLFGLVVGTVVASVIAIFRTRTRPSSGSPSADGRVRLESFFRSRNETTRRHTFRNAFLAFVALLVVTWMLWTAVAFQTVTPTRQALVGRWRGRDGNTIVFTPDGRFSGQPNGEPAPVSGTWRIGQYLGDKGVVLSIDDEGTSVLYARGSRSAPTLFVYIDDPDTNRRYEFKKQH